MVTRSPLSLGITTGPSVTSPDSQKDLLRGKYQGRRGPYGLGTTFSRYLQPNSSQLRISLALNADTAEQRSALTAVRSSKGKHASPPNHRDFVVWLPVCEPHGRNLLLEDEEFPRRKSPHQARPAYILASRAKRMRMAPSGSGSLHMSDQCRPTPEPSYWPIRSAANVKADGLSRLTATFPAIACTSQASVSQQLLRGCRCPHYQPVMPEHGQGAPQVLPEK